MPVPTPSVTGDPFTRIVSRPVLLLEKVPLAVKFCVEPSPSMTMSIM